MNHAQLAFVAILCYLAATGTIGLRLFQQHREKHLLPRSVPLVLAFLGLLVHSWLVYDAIFRPPGLNLAFFNAIALTAWTVIALLLLSSLTKPVENLGILLLPVAALSLYLEARFASPSFLPTTGWGIKTHVFFSILAYSLLTLASVQAILLAIQDHHLHSHHPGGFIRALPPLQTMEVLLFEMIGAGFVLLTLSLLSGFAFLKDMFAQHLVHKTVLSTLAWFVFGGLLIGRLRYGWRGKTAIIWTLSGFVILILAYFGSKAVLELILHRHY